jgi:hypothetical protein
VPRRGRRRREGTRWFADIHATPQAYHASPDAVIHRSAWNRNSANFAFTESSEVEVAGRRSYVTLADPYRRPVCSVALRWVSRKGRNGIVDAYPRLGTITP